MKLPYIVGAGIVVLVLAAFIASPHLRSGAAKDAESARDQATLAERALHQYNYSLPDVKRLAPPEELKKADLAAVAEQAKPAIEQGKKDFSKALNEIRSQAQKADLPAPQAEMPSADAGGLKRALTSYEQMLADNEQLLKQATQDARAAKQAGNTVVGVPQIAGMVEYARASRSLAEAGALRQQQQQLQAELLVTNTQLRGYEAARDQADGMKMTTVVAGLQKDLAELQKLASEAAARAEKAAAQVTQRQQELAPVKAEQDQLRDQLLELENKGFKPGDDAGFASYRSQYERLSTQARELQEKEELLRLGGLRGAQFAKDDYENSEIQGGEPVVSLEMLRESAAAAQEAATRSSKAVVELQKQIKSAEETGQNAQAGAEQYGQLVAGLEARQVEMLPRVLDLAKKAAEKEDEALKAAADASSAFRASQQAADAWLRDARDLQSQRDPERANPRMKMMIEDKAMPVFGSSAEAEALVLTGRIYAQRLDANRSLLADLKLLQGEAEQADAATGELQAQIDKDAGDATGKLQNAIKIYDGLTSKVNPNTKWIPQAALAGVHTLLARINPSEALAHLGDALTKIEECTGSHERSPYVRPYLELRQQLKQEVEAGRKAAETEAAASKDAPPADEN